MKTTGTTRSPEAALAALAGAQFTVMLATSIVNVALPQIRSGVGLSDSGTTWVVNAYGLAFCGCRGSAPTAATPSTSWAPAFSSASASASPSSS